MTSAYVIAVLAGLVGGFTSSAVSRWWAGRRPAVTVTRTALLLDETRPGTTFEDQDGRRWVVEARTWRTEGPSRPATCTVELVEVPEGVL
jgi:hypothetical protein